MLLVVSKVTHIFLNAMHALILVVRREMNATGEHCHCTTLVYSATARARICCNRLMIELHKQPRMGPWLISVSSNPTLMRSTTGWLPDFQSH